MNLKSHFLSPLDPHRETGSFLQLPTVGRGRTQFPLIERNHSGMKIKWKCWASSGPLLLSSQVLRWISPSKVCTELSLLQIKKIKKSSPSGWVIDTWMHPANLPIVGQGSWPGPPPWEQKEQAERIDKTFPSHSFLPQKLLVCDFLLFCRGEVKMKIEGEEYHRT